MLVAGQFPAASVKRTKCRADDKKLLSGSLRAYSLSHAVAPQVKQSKCRSGYSDLDAAQLQAKEQEAARAAAELLEQLDKEEAAKSAKAAKKKKKGEQRQWSHDACMVFGDLLVMRQLCRSIVGHTSWTWRLSAGDCSGRVCKQNPLLPKL